MKNLLYLIIIALAFCQAGFGQTETEASKTQKKEDNMTPERLVSSHLASIGSTAVLASVKSRVMVGNARLTSKLGYSGQVTGPVQFASDGEKVLFAMIFNSNDYPYEKGAYDGEDITVGRPNGNRTPLGDFLKSQGVIFKEGLIGGVLSSAWSLVNLDTKKSKLEYAGTEKINDRQLHKLKYIANKGGDLKITLYFEADTYRHVLSKYEYSIAPRLGTITTNASQKPSYYTMVEQFSDFKTADKLTLPQGYSINVTIQTESGTNSLEWTMKFSEFYFNETLDAAVFKVS